MQSPVRSRAQARGYTELITSLEDILCELTGFPGMSLHDRVGIIVPSEAFRAAIQDPLQRKLDLCSRLIELEQFQFLIPKFWSSACPPSPSPTTPCARQPLFALRGQKEKAAAYQPFVNTAAHYMNKAGALMHKVQVTTLIVHAEDDPVVSAAHTDWESMVRNKHIILLRTKRGGQQCSWRRGRRWRWRREGRRRRRCGRGGRIASERGAGAAR